MTEAIQTPAAPTSPEGAQARLGELVGSREFSERLMAGDVATRMEFQSLSTLAAGLEKLPGAEELSAIATKENDDKYAGDFVRGVKETVDVRDEVIRQAIYDKTVTKAEHTAVQQWMNRHMADQAWSKRLMAGDADARREFFLASVTLSKEPV